MTKKKTMANGLSNMEQLTNTIFQTNEYFLKQVQKQVNTALTLRNWLIGLYIVEYEQSGKDRAKYGKKIMESLAHNLKQKGLKGMAETNLKLFRLFYNYYPEIGLTVSGQLESLGSEYFTIRQTVSDEFKTSKKTQIAENKRTSISVTQLISQLSFSHFIELLKVDNIEKRNFYELHIIKNNWGVRDLKRGIDSLLYERTGLSIQKEEIIKQHHKEVKPEEVFRNTYLLEFLGLEEKPSYNESDLEERIITNLQHFLLELGRGFCFEHRQKRITFGNTHYRIDLVFYHRILKCHVLVDLKIGEFDHADAGQMNLYLNYYKENETHQNDNPPIGIILCSGKNESLVKYATMGLPQKLFVSKYLVNLPSENDLQKIIEEEQQKV